MSSSSSSSSSLGSFNPHAVHYFTSASSGPKPINPSTQVGVPTSAYPSHILLAASTSPSRTPSQNGSLPSQSPMHLSSQSLPVPIQSPQPRPIVTKGFALGSQAPSPAAITGQKKERRRQEAIFEPYNAAKRPLTPELDAVLKKRSAQWGQWELEESLNSKVNTRK